MRVSTAQITNAGVRELLLRQAEVQKTQLQLATQKRVLKPSDDPVAATTISFLQTEIAQLEQFNRNADAAESSNQLEEGVLASMNNLLFRVRELTVSLGNGAYNKEELGAISIEIEERLKELVGLSNTQNASGDYLFAGSRVKSKPITTDATGSFNYNGDQDQRKIRVSSGVVSAVSDSGFDLLMNVKNGNGKFTTGANSANTGTGIVDNGTYQAPPAFLAEPYTITFGVDVNGDTTYNVVGDNTAAVIVPDTLWQEGDEISFNGVTTEINGAPLPGDQFHVAPSTSQDIFSTIQKVIDSVTAYQDTEAGRALFVNELNSVQESLDNNMQNIDIVRGKVGTRLNSIGSERNNNLSLLVTSKEGLSNVQDLDVVEASTRFSRQLTVLEAAQASFVRVTNLNLFNFL